LVEDTPIQFDIRYRPSITIPASNFVIRLKMVGFMSFIDCRRPTEQELDKCFRIEMTVDTFWKPYSVHCVDQEARAKASKQRASISWLSKGTEITGTIYDDVRTPGVAELHDRSRVVRDVEDEEKNDLADGLIAGVQVPHKDYGGNSVQRWNDTATFPESKRDAARHATVITSEA
jgi:hypothetical protein